MPFAPFKNYKFEGNSRALNTWKAVRQRPSDLTLSSSSLSPSPVSSPSVSSPSSVPCTSSDQPGPSFISSPALASPTSPGLTPPHLLDHNYFQFPLLPSSAHSISSSSPLPGPSSNSSNTSSPSSSRAISPPSEIEMNQLFDRLAQCKSRPSILALSRTHSSAYVPLSLDQNLPSSMSVV